LQRIGVECPGSTGTRQRKTPGASKLSGSGPVVKPETPASDRKYLKLASAELAVVATTHRSEIRRLLRRRDMAVLDFKTFE